MGRAGGWNGVTLGVTLPAPRPTGWAGERAELAEPPENNILR